MKASRWVGVSIVLVAAFSAAYWIGGPPAGPKQGEGPGTEGKGGGMEMNPGMQGGQPGMQPQGGQGQMQEGQPGQQGQMGQPGEMGQQGQMGQQPQGQQAQQSSYNKDFLPTPAGSYNDDPRRFETTYKKQAELASPYWKQLSEKLEDTSLSGQARGMSERLQDQNADPLQTTHAAIMLESQVRDQGNLKGKDKLILDYLNQVTSTVIQDGDPNAIPLPN